MPPDTRTPLADALAWVDAHTAPLGPETLDAVIAGGRVLAEAVTSTGNWPTMDCAMVDGYAVRASDTDGAAGYSPAPLTAIPVVPGAAMPPGTDAVLPFMAAETVASIVQATSPVASGAGVARRGSEVAAGQEAIAVGIMLRAPELALLALLGVDRVAMVRQPHVGLVVFGHAGPDALTPMLRRLVEEDGGVAEALPSEYGADWARAGRFDLVLLAGRSGEGAGDDAPDALRHAGGTLDLHGIALRPGETAGLGRMDDVPVVLLPGMPLACLSVYWVLASRAVRRLGGRALAGTVSARLTRRISSALGFFDLVRVCLHDGAATPLASPDGGGLMSAVRADGYVMVPDGSEGMDAGATVSVYVTQ